jgi:maltose alpha-D-glucosyltransferase/alpha-amylase
MESVLANYLQTVRTIGLRTAELHLAFATPTDDPAFSAEPLTADDVKATAEDAFAQGKRAFTAVERVMVGAPEGARTLLRSFLDRREECWSLIERLSGAPVGAIKTRVHGDYHLGQVLIVQSDVMIVDFEGEPSRPAEERRGKSSPLRDVAGMLRSFSYLADTASRSVVQRFVAEEAERLMNLAEVSRKLVEETFLTAYTEIARGTPIWVDDDATRRDLLALNLLAKALYEVNYEADHRPEWIETPVRGILTILDQAGASA